VALESVEGFIEETLLSVPDIPIRKHIAKTIRQDFSSGVNGKSSFALSGFNQPVRSPVDAAYMAAKEDGKNFKPVIVSGVCNLYETLESPDGNRMDFWLEIFPHQKNPDGIEAVFRDKGKVFLQIGGLKHPPPVNPGFGRPVIYPDSYSFRVFQTQSPPLEFSTII